MGEINTRGLIRLKIPFFPEGNGSECLSKVDILSIGANTLKINGDYENAECPLLDNVDYMPYPCVSATDKTPLGDTALNSARGEAIIVCLSTHVDSIYVNNVSIAGLPIPINAEVGNNQEIKALHFVVSHKRNYMIITTDSYAPLIVMFLNITISGIAYNLRMKIV